MAGFWQTEDTMKNAPLLAERMNNLPKIVFSRTLDRVEWQNTKLVKDNIEKEMKQMKNQPGKNGGRSIFQGVKERFRLKLLEARTFEVPGNVLLRYQPAK